MVTPACIVTVQQQAIVDVDYVATPDTPLGAIETPQESPPLADDDPFESLSLFPFFDAIVPGSGFQTCGPLFDQAYYTAPGTKTIATRLTYEQHNYVLYMKCNLDIFSYYQCIFIL